MAHKLWLETRAVFLGLAAFLLVLVSIYVWLPAAPAEWDARLHRLFFAFALTAVLLSFHAFAWMHGSVGHHVQPTLFTLSLPVSRRQLVWMEAAMGLAQLTVLVVAGCSLLWIAAPSLRRANDLPAMLEYVAAALGGPVMLYALGLLLATTSGALWTLYCLAALNAFQWQLSWWQAWGGFGLWIRLTGRQVLPFATTHLATTSAVSLALAAIALYAAGRIFEQRDF